MYVKDLMTPNVITVRPSDTLATAQKILRQYGIHHLLVVDGGEVAGVLSHRDLFGRKESELVSEAMSRDIVTVTPDDTARSAASRMLGRTHGCVAVLDGRRIAGIVTSNDLLRAVPVVASGAA